MSSSFTWILHPIKMLIVSIVIWGLETTTTTTTTGCTLGVLLYWPPLFCHIISLLLQHTCNMGTHFAEKPPCNRWDCWTLFYLESPELWIWLSHRGVCLSVCGWVHELHMCTCIFYLADTEKIGTPESQWEQELCRIGNFVHEYVFCKLN